MKRIIVLIVLITVITWGTYHPASAGGAPFQWLTFVDANSQNCGSWQAGGAAGGQPVPNWLAMFAVTDGANTVVAQGTLTELTAGTLVGTFNPQPRQNPIHFVAVIYYQGGVYKLGDVTADDPCLSPSNPGPTPQPTIGPINPPAPASPSVNIRRLQFQPNASSASVQGQLTANSIDTWVVGARAGQTLSVQLTSAYGQGIVYIYGVDGTVLQTPQRGASNFQGVLPSTQDYYVNVLASANGNFGYTLYVAIPPRR